MVCVTMKKAIEAPESGMSNEENDISNHQEEELTTRATLGPPKINHLLPIVNFRYLSASPWTQRPGSGAEDGAWYISPRPSACNSIINAGIVDRIRPTAPALAQQ